MKNFRNHPLLWYRIMDAALTTQTEDTAQSQNPAAPGEQGTGYPVAGVQPPAASVLEGTYPMSDLRRDRHRGPPSHGKKWTKIE
jgi:hypothetical protein